MVTYQKVKEKTSKGDYREVTNVFNKKGKLVGTIRERSDGNVSVASGGAGGVGSTTYERVARSSSGGGLSSSPQPIQAQPTPVITTTPQARTTTPFSNGPMSSVNRQPSFFDLATQSSQAPAQPKTQTVKVIQQTSPFSPKNQEMSVPTSQPIASSVNQGQAVYSDGTVREAPFWSRPDVRNQTINDSRVLSGNTPTARRLAQLQPQNVGNIGNMRPANLSNTGVRESQISTVGAKAVNFGVGGFGLLSASPVVAGIPVVGPPLALGSAVVGEGALVVSQTLGLGTLFRKQAEAGAKGNKKDILMSDAFNLAYDKARTKEDESIKGFYPNFKDLYGNTALFLGARVEGAQVLISKVKSGGKVPVAYTAEDVQKIISPKNKFIDFETQYAQSQSVFDKEFRKEFKGTPAQTKDASRLASAQRRYDEVALGFGVRNANLASEGASLSTQKTSQLVFGKTTSKSMNPALRRTAYASIVGGAQEGGTQYVQEQILKNREVNPLNLGFNVVSGSAVSATTNVLGQTLNLKSVSTDGFKSKLYGGASKAYNFGVDVLNPEEKEPDLQFGYLSPEVGVVKIKKTKSVVFDTSFNTANSKANSPTTTRVLFETDVVNTGTKNKNTENKTILPTFDYKPIENTDRPTNRPKQRPNNKNTTYDAIIGEIVPDVPDTKQPLPNTSINSLTTITNIYNTVPTRNINPMRGVLIPPVPSNLGFGSGSRSKRGKTPIYANELNISLGLLQQSTALGINFPTYKAPKRKQTKQQKKQSKKQNKLSKRLDRNFNKTSSLLFGGFKL